MWVANLHTNKGATLAQYIIDNNYRDLPKAICVKSKYKLYDFGNLCPKLKTIILFYKIPVVEDLDLLRVLRKI